MKYPPIPRFPACVVVALVCIWIGPAVCGQEKPKVPAAAARSPWERIVLIGASASAGFTATEPMGGPDTEKFRLHRYLDAAVLVPHEPPRNVASAFFFLQPEADARRQLDEVLPRKPTLVVGVDFLFWFCYGLVTNEDERMKRFETGLKLLEEVPGALVVGDIPDASSATDMLAPEVIPTAATRAAANRRLKEWAARRRQVAVVSLSDFMRTALANEALTVHGRTLPAGKTRGLLQPDKLHPSTRGCTVLTLAIMEALRSTQPVSFTNDIRWDFAEVQRLGSGAPPATNAAARSTIPAAPVNQN
jgi:hypothetical protein